VVNFNIIDTAQKLLATQFSLVGGLQDTEHGVLYTFITPNRDFIRYYMMMVLANIG